MIVVITSGVFSTSVISPGLSADSALSFTGALVAPCVGFPSATRRYPVPLGKPSGERILHGFLLGLMWLASLMGTSHILVKMGYLEDLRSKEARNKKCSLLTFRPLVRDWIGCIVLTFCPRVNLPTWVKKFPPVFLQNVPTKLTKFLPKLPAASEIPIEFLQGSSPFKNYFQKSQ